MLMRIQEPALDVRVHLRRRVGGKLPRPHGACWPDWLWLPPAAASNRACGSPAQRSPTSFTDRHTQL